MRRLLNVFIGRGGGYPGVERRLFERVLRNNLVIQRETESSHELHFLLKEDC